MDAQRNYAESGASKPRSVEHARTPLASEQLDEGFRYIDTELDNFEAIDDKAAEWPDDKTALYWWRPSFWRRAEC
jgi:hypothetical protein